MCVCSLWNISLMNRFQMCLLCVKLPSFLCGTRPKTSAAQTRFHFIHWMIEKLAQNKQPSEEFFRIIYIFKSQCVHFFISPQKCVRNDTHRLKPLKKRVLMEQLNRTHSCLPPSHHAMQCVNNERDSRMRVSPRETTWKRPSTGPRAPDDHMTTDFWYIQQTKIFLWHF